MVSILPAERTPWDVIGKSIGSNISQNLPGAVQQGYQRQTGLNSIDQLQKELALAGGDINKMLPALARAYTLNPSLERSGLGQAYLQNAAATGQGNALADLSPNKSTIAGSPAQPNQSIIEPIAQETQKPQPVIAEGKSSSKDIANIANQYIGELRPDLVNPASQYGAINTFNSAIKQDLTPEEEGQLRQQLMDKYKSANIVTPVVDRIREGIKTKYNEALDRYKFDADKLNQIQQKWGEFTKQSPQRLAPFIEKYGENFPKTKDLLLNKYNQYAGDLPTNMTPEQMHSNAMALLDNDMNKLDALQAIPAMPPVHTEKGVKEYLDTYKDAYKDLADRGFTEALREDAINNKDMGNEEFHSIIWGNQTSQHLLNDIHSIKAPEEYKQIGASGVSKYNPLYPKQHEKYISDLSEKLKKLKPEDDLVLSRAMALDSNGSIKDFNEALNRAQKEGLKLSEFQRSQLQEINIPRVPPLWEIFSNPESGSLASSPAGLIGSMVTGFNWKPFINYLRGKK